MPIRDPEYPRISTTNDKQARKASNHLEWLEGVCDAVQRLQQFVCDMAGGRDGVFATGIGGTDALKVSEQDPVSMKVDVAAGWVAVDGVPRYMEAFTSGTLTAPSANPRIDTVAANAKTGDITIHSGAEAVSPTAPTAGASEVKLAEIYHRTGETSIKDADDGTNGYITDARTGINF